MGRGSHLKRRTYGQRDAVASALDVVGDRWTLLVIRELVLGPRRWTDLLDRLGGIGKNLLSDRLRHLEDEGLVTTAVLPWSSSRTKLYSLSAEAEDLERLVLDLARLGLRRMPPVGEVSPEWAAIALTASVDRWRVGILHVAIDDSWFTVRSGGGDVQGRRGREGEATEIIQGTPEQIVARAVAGVATGARSE